MSMQRRRFRRRDLNRARRRSPARARHAQRGLFAERLEDRRLLTGATQFPFHNPIIPTDVTGDFLTTPKDALRVINSLNEEGAHPLDPNAKITGSHGNSIDVFADNQVTPIDALQVINLINSGEGLGEVVAFRLELQDSTGTPLTNNVVKVGQEYRLQMYVEDLRSSPTGVFAAYADIAYTDPSLFSLQGIFPNQFADPNNIRAAATVSAQYPNGLTIWPSSWTGVPSTVPADADGIDDDGLANPNELDEVGAFSGFTPLGAGEFPVVYVTFKAESPGGLDFSLNNAELSQSDILFFGGSAGVPANVVDYNPTGPLHVDFVQDVNAEDDAFPVDPDVILEDSSTIALDVLANDFLSQDNTGTLALDPDPGNLTQPANGTVALAGNVINYTPDPDFFGTDSFTYTAIDGQGNSDTATVSLTVTSVNDPPVAVDDTFQNLLEDSGNNVLDVLINDNAGPLNEDQTLTVTEIVVPPSHGTLIIGAGGANVEYTPDANFFGNDTFTYRIADSGNLSSDAQATIIVDPVNDPPIAVDDDITGIAEDSSGNVLAVLTNDSAGPGNEDSIQGIKITQVGATNQGGTVTISVDQQTLSYTPAADFFGDETFSYTIQDDDGAEASATVTVTVDNINDPPDAVDDTVFVDEFSTANPLDVLANDNAGAGGETDALVITNVTTPDQGGSVSIVTGGGSLDYAPDPTKLGPFTETFQYTISDGEFTDTATVTVNVEPVIRPRARDDQFDVQEDSALADNVFDVTVNDLFNDGANILPITIVTNPQHGTAEVFNDLSIRYQPDPDYFGPDSLEYQIDDDFTGQDGDSVPDIGLLSLNVINVNDPPIANIDDTFAAVPEDSVDAPLDVLANDKAGPDNETEPIFVVDVTQPANGTVTIGNGGANVLYTPNPDYFGPDSFSYTISDGELTDTASVSVTVDNVNDPPIAVDDQFDNIQEDTADNLLDVLKNDAAGPTNETEAISVTVVTQPSHGTVTIGTDGDNVLYTPDADYFGPDSFTYTISDGTALTATATVNLTVQDVNDDPTAVDDQLLALKDFTDQSLDVLVNDTIAPDVGEVLTITGLGPQGLNSISTPHGTATIAPDGKSVIYTPDAGFETSTGGFDTFTYTITDGREGSSTGNAQIEVVDAVPSDVSGTIFMDVNNNGVQDPQEIKLAGVEVNLVGTNIRGELINTTVTSDVNGVFMFKDVLPNALDDVIGYAVTANTPEYVIDGLDGIRDQRSDVNDDDYVPGQVGNDVFTGIELGFLGTQRSEGNYTVGERGLTGKFVTIAQYLSSTRKGLAMATTMAGDDYWFSVMQGWDGLRSAHVQLANDLASAELTVVDVQGQTHTRTITYKDYHVAGDRNTGQYMIFFNGSAEDLGFSLPGDQLSAVDPSTIDRVPAEGQTPADAAALEAEQMQMYAQSVDAIFGSGDWA